MSLMLSGFCDWLQNTAAAGVGGIISLLSKAFCTSPETASTGGGGESNVFARSGTEATVTDWEGIVRPTLANEMRMQGFRRVENLIQNSGDMQAASWTANAGATVTSGETDPEGGATAFRLTSSNTNCQLYEQLTPTIGREYVASWWIKRVTGTGIVNIWNGDNWEDVTTAVTTSWQRIATGATAAGGATEYPGVKLESAGDAVDIWHPMYEDVTGQADQNPSEYVSVGVATGDQLIEDWTDATQWLDCPGYSVVNTQSYTGGRIRVEHSSGSGGVLLAYKEITGLTIGKTYYLKGKRYKGTNGACGLQIKDGCAGSTLANDYGFNDNESVFLEWVSSKETVSIALAAGYDTAGTYVEFADIEFFEADHGAFVDGVKYFANLTNNNTVSGGVVNEVDATAGSTTISQGLLIEPSATNDISESYDVSTWTATRITPTLGNGTIPVGGQLESTLATFVTNNSCYIYKATTNVVNTSAYTFTLIARPIDHTIVQITGSSGTFGGTVYANFDMTGSGSKGTAGAGVTDYTIKKEGAFYIMTMTATPSTGGVNNFIVGIQDSTSDSRLASSDFSGGSVSIYFGGVNFEESDYPTSYIPTSGGADSRSSEVCNIKYSGDEPTDAGHAVVKMVWPTGHNATTTGTANIVTMKETDDDNLLHIQFTTAGRVGSSMSAGNVETTTQSVDAGETILYAVTWDINDTITDDVPSEINIVANNCYNDIWNTSEGWTGVINTNGFDTDSKNQLTLDGNLGASAIERPMLFQGIKLSSTRLTTDEMESNYCSTDCL